MVANKSVTELINNTPLVELKKFDTGPCRLFMKIEGHNPGGSIKDRMAVSMIDAAEKSGALKPGGTIIEATAGNTGLGISLVAAQRGYKVVLVVFDKIAKEKILHCELLGAKIIWTRSDVSKGHPEYYADMAERLAKENGWFHVDQFNNPANADVHIRRTGPEIFEQMDGDVDAIVCGIGSGGTMGGLQRFFRDKSPKTEMILADPAGSALAGLVNDGKPGPEHPYKIEGIGQDYIPAHVDPKLIKKAYSISDEESFRMVRELVAKESILAGLSTGTLLATALKYCREQTAPKRVVTFMCDRGEKYLGKIGSEFIK
jgi:cystathionine beta-synthase